MSVPTTIQSNQVPLAISVDGITYKNVVCKRAWNFNGTTAVNSEETDCGIAKGLGANDWNIDFEGVLNTTPTSSTEASASDILGYWSVQQLIYVKTQTGNGTGKNIYVQGQAYITDFKIADQVGNLIAFSFTAAGVGDPDITV